METLFLKKKKTSRQGDSTFEKGKVQVYILKISWHQGEAFFYFLFFYVFSFSIFRALPNIEDLKHARWSSEEALLMLAMQMFWQWNQVRMFILAHWQTGINHLVWSLFYFVAILKEIWYLDAYKHNSLKGRFDLNVNAAKKYFGYINNIRNC